MSRLAARARLGFYPLNPNHARMIASWIVKKKPDHRPRIIDPCAGEGIAIQTIAQELEIAPDLIYLNEIHPVRAQLCHRVSSNVTVIDARDDLRAPKGMFQLAYMNPEFGTDADSESTSTEDGVPERKPRMEITVWNHMVQSQFIQPDGVVVLVGPEATFRSQPGMEHLLRSYDRIRFFVLPEDETTYTRKSRELIVLGKMRRLPRTRGEVTVHQERLLAMIEKAGPLRTYTGPTDGSKEDKRYALPRPTHVPGGRLYVRSKTGATPQDMFNTVMQTGGVFTTKAHRPTQREKPIVPISKINRGQAIMLIAAGILNRQLIAFGDRTFRIKGTIIKSTVRTEEEVTEGYRTIRSIKHITRQDPHITLLDEEQGKLYMFRGDEGIRKLLTLPNAFENLLTALQRTIPPHYTNDILPEDINVFLDSITPKSGKHLEGYAPGMIPKQKEIVAAILYAWLYPTRVGDHVKKLLLMADMGCGKTTMAIVAAMGLWTFKYKKKPLMLSINGIPTAHAFVSLVVAPNHLAGTRDQVERYREAVRDRVPPNELPEVATWFKEIIDLMPFHPSRPEDNWYIQVVETPGHLGAFMRHAIEEPDRPHLMILSMTKMSLGPGWDAQVNTHRTYPVQPAQRADESDHEYEQRIQQRVDMARQMKLRTEARYQAMGFRKTGAHDRRDRITQQQHENQRTNHRGDTNEPGVSARTERRDWQLNVIKRTGFRYETGRTRPNILWTWDGYFCPDCGIQLLKKGLQLVTSKDLKRRGRTKCLVCGTKLGMWTRDQDAVGDRDLPIFTIENQAELDLLVPNNAGWRTPWREYTRWVPKTLEYRPKIYVPQITENIGTYFTGNKIEVAGPPNIDIPPDISLNGPLSPEDLRQWMSTTPVMDTVAEIMTHAHQIDGKNRVVYVSQAQLQPDSLKQDGSALLSEQSAQTVPAFKLTIPIQTPTVVWKAEQRKEIPWGTRPVSNPRMALAELISNRYTKRIQLMVADEIHYLKGKNTVSTRGRLGGVLMEKIDYGLYMSGTVYGGKVSSIFFVLFRGGNAKIRRQYHWNDLTKFIIDAGLIEEETRQVIEDRDPKASQTNGEARKAYPIPMKERSGLTARALSLVLHQAITVTIDEMGFRMKTLTRRKPDLFQLPPDIQAAYDNLIEGGKAIIKDGGHDALSSYLQAALVYPYIPWKPVTITSKSIDDSYTAQTFPQDRILPHHEYLASYLYTQCVNSAENRRAIIFCTHTVKHDIMADVQEKVARLLEDRHGVKNAKRRIVVLRQNTVSPGERDAWLRNKAKEGAIAVLCHPGLVETGLNLIEWTEVIHLQPTYRPQQDQQATRRVHRPTQTRDVFVSHCAYANTMSERALGRLALKVLAAELLMGGSADGPIFGGSDAGTSILNDLAQMVLAEAAEGTGDDDNSIGAMQTALEQFGTEKPEEGVSAGTTDPDNVLTREEGYEVFDDGSERITDVPDEPVVATEPPRKEPEQPSTPPESLDDFLETHEVSTKPTQRIKFPTRNRKRKTETQTKPDESKLDDLLDSFDF